MLLSLTTVTFLYPCLRCRTLSRGFAGTRAVTCAMALCMSARPQTLGSLARHRVELGSSSSMGPEATVLIRLPARAPVVRCGVKAVAALGKPDSEPKITRKAEPDECVAAATPRLDLNHRASTHCGCFNLCYNG